MSSSRLLSNRALFAAIRSNTCARVIRRPATRNFAILPTNQPITASRSYFRHTIRAKKTIPRPLCRQSIRNFWINHSKSSANPTPHLGSPEPAPSLAERLRKLSREYGWSALGVYFALSALDFPFCFLAVRLLGTDRIGRWEHAVIGAFWNLVRIPFPDFVNERQAANAAHTDTATGEITTAAREGVVGWNSEMVQAEKDNKGSNASVWTQLALAYAIHKSFIFLRVPLTAAVTPKVVKTLRGWGWDIGKRKPKAAPKATLDPAKTAKSP